MMRFLTIKSSVQAFLLVAFLLLSNTQANCCEFCGAVNATFTEEIGLSDMAVYAKLVKLAPKHGGAAQNTGIDDVPRATFVTVKVLKGEAFVKVGIEFQAIFFGEVLLEELKGLHET